MEQVEPIKGTHRRAYRLVINHCSPSMPIELELELTKLATTALLLELDEAWLVEKLEQGSKDVIAERVRRSIH